MFSCQTGYCRQDTVKSLIRVIVLIREIKNKNNLQKPKPMIYFVTQSAFL